MTLPVAARPLGLVHRLRHAAAVQLLGIGRSDSEASSGSGAAAQGGLLARRGRATCSCSCPGASCWPSGWRGAGRLDQDRGDRHVHRGVLERLGRARPVVCPESHHLVHRPCDQQLRRHGGCSHGLALGPPGLACRVGTAPAVDQCAAARGLCLGDRRACSCSPVCRRLVSGSSATT